MKDPDDCFPLDLSDFEYYTYRDDSAEHPMVMVLRIHLEGRLEAETLRSSFREALSHHPLLRCVISQTGRRLRWVPAEADSPRINCTWHDSPYPPTDCPLVRIDLKQETGARFDVRICRDRSVLVAWFHHACVDGIGAIRFLSDVFAVYGQNTATSEADRPSITLPDPEVLKLRGRCPRLGKIDGKGKSWTEWLRGPSRFLFGKNYCLKGGGELTAHSGNPQNILQTAVLPRTVARKLKHLAATNNASTNDLCLMVYLQQIAQWSQADPNAHDNDLFRILMPVSMRTPDLDGISAANVLSYVFQPFRRRDCQIPAALLTTIHRRTADMLHSNEGVVLLKLFSLVRRVPGLFGLSRALQPSFATAVLANVGELKRVFGSRFPMKKGRVVAGNLVIQRIDGIAPLRKNTNVAISFGGYGGDMILNLRANPEAMSDAEAALFLDQVVTRLSELAENQSLESPVESGGQLQIAVIPKGSGLMRPNDSEGAAVER